MGINCCSSRMVFLWTVLAALAFGGSLLLAFWGIPKIIISQVHKNTQLKEGTDQWDRFTELPFPINFTIRFFEVTNGKEVLENGSKPILKESPPYRYEQTIKKEFTFDDDEEDSVTYYRSLSFRFDNSENTRESDEVTIINPVLMSALQLTTDIERIAFAGCIEHLLKPYGMDTIFIKKSVRSLIFDGITFGWENNTEKGYACEIVRQRMIEIVEPIRVIEYINEEDGNGYFKFAMFNYRTKNYCCESPDGVYVVNRGNNDISQLGNTMRWNQDTHISTWGTSISTNNDTCNKVGGSDATIFPPQLKEDDQLQIFNTDLCRTVQLVHNGTETYKGIKGFRYEIGSMTFRHNTLNPENDCFCTKSTKDIEGKSSCYLNGVFDFKPCLGAPILVSQPHFYNADSIYLQGVSGLKPNKTLHDIYLIIEPNTGTPLEGWKRVQLNAVMRKQDWISFVTPQTMANAYVPIMWLEEGVNLPQKYVDLITEQYFKPLKIANGVKYALVALFAAIFAGCLFIAWRKEFFKKKRMD